VGGRRDFQAVGTRWGWRIYRVGGDNIRDGWTIYIGVGGRTIYVGHGVDSVGHDIGR